MPIHWMCQASYDTLWQKLLSTPSSRIWLHKENKMYLCNYRTEKRQKKIFSYYIWIEQKEDGSSQKPS